MGIGPFTMVDRDGTSALIEEFVAELANLDVKLWLDGGQLRCNAPNNVLTPKLQARLVERKADLLAFLGRTSGSERARDLTPAPRDGDIPLTHSQERIWSLSEMRPGASVYNKTAAYRLVGALDAPTLEQSLNELQRRHEILRTSFPAAGRKPRQNIAPAVPLVLPITDVQRELRKLGAKACEKLIVRFLLSEAERPFDLQRGPLWRCQLVRLSREEHIFSFTMHHIIFDGFSKDVFLRELSTLYRAYSTGEAPELPDLPVQYADFSIWRRNQLSSETDERQFAFWKERLGGTVAPLRLPIDHPRSDSSIQNGTCRYFDLPDQLASGIGSLSRSAKASLFVILHAAYGVMLNRYSGQKDMIICSPLAARDRTELENLIGYFNNIVAIRIDLSGDPSFREVLARVRRAVLDAHDNQHLPLQRLAELPNLARVPLNRGMFCYQDVSSRTIEIPNITATPMALRTSEADFELAIYIEGTSNGNISGLIDYSADLFEEETITRLLRNYSTILDRVTANPDEPLSQLPRFDDGPGEIVAALEAHPRIDQAVITDLPDRSGSAAYLVLNEFDVPNLAEIRQFLEEKFPAYLVPEALIPLDVLPLLSDGTVDLGALPPPSVHRSRLDTPYIAPRTKLERQIADIWKKALWLDQDVGILDNFRDLGGHSLLSVQLVLMLESELQRTLPIRAVTRLSTVAEMAEILEQGDTGEEGLALTQGPAKLPREIHQGLLTYTASWTGDRLSPESVIVGLNLKGSQQALFWCLQREKEFTQLAKYLGSDQPLYGMRSGNRVMVKAQGNINALAAHYVDEILAIQPQGPYLIGGNCQAAQIAFQIAKRLRELNHEITLLTMLEKFVPEEYSGRIKMLYGADSNRNPYLFFQTPEFGWRKYYSGPLSIERVAGRHAQFFREPNIQTLSDAVRRGIDEALSADGATMTPPANSAFQLLPATAYRAQLNVSGPETAEPGAKVDIRVELRNASSEIWRPAKVSGIMLANRWLNTEGEVVNSADGRTPLTVELAPGASTTLILQVNAPMRTGLWTLELDMVDEGVTWFSSQGSPTARLDIVVRGATGTWGGLTEKFRNLATQVRDGVR